jgi:hypothetical protein
MIDFLHLIGFTLFVALCMDAMDANYFNAWLKPYGQWFRNNWRIKYHEDGSRKWWTYTPLVTLIDFWHTAKAVLLIGMFSYVAVMHGKTWLYGLLMWGLFGLFHEVFYRRLFRTRNHIDP